VRQIEANEGKSSQGNCDTQGQTMTTLEATKLKNSSGVTCSGQLFVLELSGDRIHSMKRDGSDRKTIVTNCRFPDGIGVDYEAGHPSRRGALLSGPTVERILATAK
jgi:hypothetical protein